MASLRSRIVKPVEKKFFYKILENGVGVEIVGPKEAGGDFSITARYVTQREYQAILTDNIERVAASRKGLKKITLSEENARRQLCHQIISAWDMPLRAAYALRFPIDLSQSDPDEPVEFNEENIDAMAEESELWSLVNTIANSHELWFPGEDVKDKDDDDVLGDTEGNSGSGPNSNSAG